MATPTSVTVAEDGSLGIRLAGTDPDGTVVRYRVATQPANGTLSGTGPDLTYAPDADFNGRDAFTFTVTDDEGVVSAAAQVDAEVTAVACQGDRDVLETFTGRPAATNGPTTMAGSWRTTWRTGTAWMRWAAASPGFGCGKNGLRGTLPWELGSLTMLEYLDLGRGGCHREESCTINVLTGGIPRELGNLANLGWLRLDG